MNSIFKIILLLTFLLLPIQVSAQTCSKEDMSRINSFIKNIELSYSHKGDNYFEVRAYNVPTDLYITDSAGNKFVNVENNILKAYGYIGGESYTFYIYSINDNKCINEMNYTKTIYIKKYNEYSEKEICQNTKYKSFKLCNEWYQGSITDEKFEKELKKYEKNLTTQELVVDEEITNDVGEKIVYIIIISSITLIIFITVLLIKHKKKRRVL